MAADLEIRIGAELTEIKGALAGLQRDFQRVGQSAQQAGQRGDFGRLERNVGGAITQVRGLIGAIAGLAGVMKLIGKADELNSLNARLKLATSSTEEFTRAQAELFAMAQRTRSSLGETVRLYSSISQAVKEAGVGQNVLLGVVETINQAVQLSGASAQAAEAALVQLGQGLASGTLRGEELNSILEQTPALADAIAKGMGITRGELRKYGEEGKITAQAVIESLQRQREEVARQFAQLPVTVGQATTQLGNASLQLLGTFDQTSGATAGLAKAISGLADILSGPDVTGAIQDFAGTWGTAFGQIVQDFRDAVSIIQSEMPGLVDSTGREVGFLARAFSDLPANVRAWLQLTVVAVASEFEKIEARAIQLREGIAAIFNDETLAGVEQRYIRRLKSIEQATKESVDEILGQREQALNAGQNRRDLTAANARNEAALRRRGDRAGRDPNAAGTFRTTRTNEQQRAAEQQRKAQLDAQERLTRDATQRELEILKEGYEDGITAAADYFRRRQEIELAALDRSIAIERQRAQGGSQADKTKALAEIELLERQKADIQRNATRDAAQAQRELDRELTQARAQDLENQGRAGDAARLRLEAQYSALIQKLGRDSEGAKLIQRLIDTGVAQAQFQELQKQFDATLESLERRRAEIANRVRIGAVSGPQARQEEAAAGADATTKLQALRTEMQLLADATKNPAIIEGLNGINDAIKRIGDEGVTGFQRAAQDLRASLAEMESSFAQSATSAGVDAITGLFTDLATKPQDADEAMKDFVRGFVQSMAQIAARALATYLVLQLLDAIYPGLGKAAAAGMSVGANVKHSGGIAGQGTTRDVSPLLFAGAPRFHNGSGVLGLKPGEIPAILQEGERVQSRSEVAAQQSGGGGSGTRIINVIDPALVQDYMTSSAGEQTILNVIQRNAGSVRQTLA